MLEQYLYVYCNYKQNNWSDFLLLAKSIYNNTLSTITSISLFFANKGYYPSINVHLEQDITSSYVHKFAINLNELQGILKTNISTTQQQYW